MIIIQSLYNEAIHHIKVSYHDFIVLAENCLKKMEECMDYEVQTSEIMQSRYAGVCIIIFKHK